MGMWGKCIAVILLGIIFGVMAAIGVDMLYRAMFKKGGK